MGNTIVSTNEEHSNQSPFCELMKNQTFYSSNGPKLKEKVKPKNESDKFGKIEKSLNCLLGNGQNGTFPIREVAEHLLIRNYPEVASFDGKGKLVIFVPEWFLSKAVKCVDPSQSTKLQGYSTELVNDPNLCPERKKYFEDLKLFNYYAGG